MMIEQSFEASLNELSTYLSHLVLEKPREKSRNPTSLTVHGNFILEDNDFLQQFSSFYQDRLKKLQKLVYSNKKVSTITAAKGKAIIVGTLHKNYAKKRKEVVDDSKERVYNDNDTIDLGDQSGNIKLLFTKQTFLDTGFFMIDGRQCHNITIHDIPHGIVCGIQGQLEQKLNKFKCQRIFMPILQPERPINAEISHTTLTKSQFFSRTTREDDLIILTSSQSMRHLQIINDYLMASGNFCQQELSRIAQITSLILCGFKLQGTKLSAGLWSLDSHLLNISQNITGVFLMPDRDTIQARTWPVRPLTGCQLPNSSKRIMKCANPEVFRHPSGLTMIGTCGENIKDTPRICTLQDQLTIMSYQLMFGHLAPNAPSTLQTEPTAIDTMVLTRYPHVYFSATQGPFRTKTITIDKHICKLMLIPSTDNGIVLLNPRNMDTLLMKIM